MTSCKLFSSLILQVISMTQSRLIEISKNTCSFQGQNLRFRRINTVQIINVQNGLVWFLFCFFREFLSHFQIISHNILKWFYVYTLTECLVLIQPLFRQLRFFQAHTSLKVQLHDWFMNILLPNAWYTFSFDNFCE